MIGGGQMQQGNAAFRSDSSCEWTLHKIWPPSTLNTHPQTSTHSNPRPSTPNPNVQSNLQRELSAEFVRFDRNPLQLEAQAAADGRVGGQAEGAEVSAESAASAAAPHALLECSQPSLGKHEGDDLDKGAELFFQFLASANKAATKPKKAKPQGHTRTEAAGCLPPQHAQPVPMLEPQRRGPEAWPELALLGCGQYPPFPSKEYVAPATLANGCVAGCDNGAAQTVGPGSFPKQTRGGGNLAHVKDSDRVLQVQLNQDGVALWEPRNSYAAQIFALKGFIEALPSEAISHGEIQHPLLHVSGVRIPLDVSDMMERSIYGHRKPGNKAFHQLLSYLGMRSSIEKMARVRTLSFDPEAWNRMGVRLIKGGDSKGGKPKIVYVR